MLQNETVVSKNDTVHQNEKAPVFEGLDQIETIFVGLIRIFMGQCPETGNKGVSK